MERLPDPIHQDLCDLLERSDRLIWRSNRAHAESMRLTRHLADLNADSDKLIERCRRLVERPLRNRIRPPGPREASEE